MHTHAHMGIHTRAILVPKTQSAACPLPLCWIYCDSHYANEIPTVTLSFCICFSCFLLKPLPKRQLWAKCISSAFSLLLFRTAGFPCGSPEERPSAPSEEGGGGLRPWGHDRPRVSVATELDIDRPWLLLQRLTAHLPGQKKQLLGNCISVS